MHPFTQRVNGEESETDIVFDILSSPRRRFAIRLLYEKPDRIRTLQQLSEYVAARENHIQVGEVTQAERKRVYVSLYQTHVPKLQEAGIVRYDHDTGHIKLTNRLGRVGTYLDIPIQTYDIKRVFLVLTTVSTLFLFAVLVDAPLFASIPDPVAALFVLVGISSVAVYLAVRGHERPEIPLCTGTGSPFSKLKLRP